MRASQLNARIEVFIRSLGTPHFQYFYPLAPVPRHAGKPRFISRKRAEEGDSEARRYLKVHEFRENVKLLTKNIYKKDPFTGPVFAFMEFYALRPKSHRKSDPPIMVETRPDAKNYLWAMEDALNPRYETIKAGGGRKSKMLVWPGLWRDDSQVTTFPIRRWSDTPGEVGIRLSVWSIDNEAAS